MVPLVNGSVAALILYKMHLSQNEQVKSQRVAHCEMNNNQLNTVCITIVYCWFLTIVPVFTSSSLNPYADCSQLNNIPVVSKLYKAILKSVLHTNLCVLFSFFSQSLLSYVFYVTILSTCKTIVYWLAPFVTSAPCSLLHDLFTSVPYTKGRQYFLLVIQQQVASLKLFL